MYGSTIEFTLDTICPWTYLAKKRLDEALRIIRSDATASTVSFTLNFAPYQLYPEASQAGEDKYTWYQKSRYGDSEEKMKMYVTLMSAYGQSAGIDFKFGGTVANTMDAHRLIQHFQTIHGPTVANALVDSLYHQYFTLEQHPSSPSTLLAACADAGIPTSEAKAFIENEDEGLAETKKSIAKQRSDGVDSVPLVRIEGKRRDITLQGANEVEDYVKALKTIVKESS